MLAAPALSLKTGFPNAGDNPTSTTERRAYDLLADGFGPGFNAPLLVVADLEGTGADRRRTSPSSRSASPPTRGSRRSATPQVSANGDTVVLPDAAHDRAGRPGHGGDARADPGHHPRRAST